MKYRVHIEAEIIIDLKPGDIEDEISYCEQVGLDSLRVPDYALAHTGVDLVSADAEEEKE